MTLHISEAEVRSLLTMPMAIEAVEEISRRQATGEAVVHARRRIELPGGGFFITWPGRTLPRASWA